MLVTSTAGVIKYNQTIKFKVKVYIVSTWSSVVFRARFIDWKVIWKWYGPMYNDKARPFEIVRPIILLLHEIIMRLSYNKICYYLFTISFISLFIVCWQNFEGALDQYSIYLCSSNSAENLKLSQYRNFQLILAMRFHFMSYFVNSIISRVSNRLLDCVFIEVDFEE